MPHSKAFRDLNVWQRSMDLVERIYEVTASFPRDERFGLTSEIRRAAVSVPSNIGRRIAPEEAEGVPQSPRHRPRFPGRSRSPARDCKAPALLEDRGLQPNANHRRRDRPNAEWANRLA